MLTAYTYAIFHKWVAYIQVMRPNNSNVVGASVDAAPHLLTSFLLTMNSLQEDTSQRVHPRSHSKQVAGQNSNPRVDDAKVCAFHHFIPFRSQGAGWARRDLTGKPHGKVIDVGLQSHTEDSNHNSVTNALCGLVQVTQLLCMFHIL